MPRHAVMPACMLLLTPMAATTVPPIAPPALVPVLLRPDPNMDACPSTVRPRLPQGGKDGFLSLRTGPGTAWPEMAQLSPATLMFECEARPGWSAVIVQPRGGGDCAMPVPSRNVLHYRGPCRYGWVARGFLETVAG